MHSCWFRLFGAGLKSSPIIWGEPMALFLGYILFSIPEGLNVCSTLNINDFHDSSGVEDVGYLWTGLKSSPTIWGEPMALFLGYILFSIPVGLNVCSTLNINDFHDPDGVECGGRV